MKGKIIVIEGTDCSGKETQTSLLVQRLRKSGRKIEHMCFPNYDSPTGKIIGGAYLGRSYIGESVFSEGVDKVDPKVAALYYAADRRYNRQKILDLLNDGVDVILDRYVESNMGHQGAKIFDKDERLKLYDNLATLEYEFLELPKPDLTIFLYMPYKIIAELKKGREDVNLIYVRNAEQAYLELVDLHGYKKIDCTDKKDKLRDMLEIHEDIYKLVAKELKLK